MDDLHGSFISPGVPGITWVNGCLLDGNVFTATELHKLTLVDDNQDLLSSGDPSADPLFRTHLNSNDPYLISMGDDTWNVGQNAIAAPLG